MAAGFAVLGGVVNFLERWPSTAEGVGLENRYTLTGIVSSNLTLSANFKWAAKFSRNLRPTTCFARGAGLRPENRWWGRLEFSDGGGMFRNGFGKIVGPVVF